MTVLMKNYHVHYTGIVTASMDCILVSGCLFYPCIKVKGILNKFIIHLLCFLFFLKQRHISYTFIWLGVLVFNMVHLFKIKFYWSIVYRLQIISSVQFSVLNELNSHSPTLEHLYPKEFSCPFFISLHCLLSSQQALIYICR